MPVTRSYFSAAYWCRNPCDVTLRSAFVMPTVTESL